MKYKNQNRCKNKCFFWIIFILITFFQNLTNNLLFAQIVINDVLIKGNKRTKLWIITRELDIKKGDTLQVKDLDSLLKLNQQKIFNTQLFLEVKIEVLADDTLHYTLHNTLKTKENFEEKNKKEFQYIKINILLKERWYIFPIPIFELSDRNFNEWWNTYNHDFNRTNYGIRFAWDNVTGRKDELDLVIQSGFNQRFAVGYKYPYLDKKRRLGLEFNVSYLQNKSTAYRTQNHKLLFLKTDNFVRERLEARIAFNYRKGFFTSHNLLFNYRKTSVNDTILDYNPFYFSPQKNTQNLFTITYSGRYDRRDVQYYALKGWTIGWHITQNLGENVKGIGAGFGVTKYNQLAKKWFSDHTLRGYYSDWFGYQPYAQAQALGYGQENLRGFDLYVIDGQAYFLQKNTLKFQIFDKKYKLFPKTSALNNFPIALYATAFVDMGYVKDDYFREFNTTFNNTFLYSGGVGIDVVTFYNMVFSFTFAQNKRQEIGFFFGFNGLF